MPGTSTHARVLPRTSTHEFCRERAHMSIAETEHARVLLRTSRHEYCRERALTSIAEVRHGKTSHEYCREGAEHARVVPRPSSHEYCRNRARTSTAENEHARVLPKPDMEKPGAMQSVTAQEAKDFLHNTSSSSAWPFLATITRDIWDPPTLAVPFPQQGRQTGPNHASSSPDKSGQF